MAGGGENPKSSRVYFKYCHIVTLNIFFSGKWTNQFKLAWHKGLHSFDEQAYR